MDGPVYQKTIEFSISLISLYKHLIYKKEYIISKQLLRSGTSIGANVLRQLQPRVARTSYLRCQLPPKK
jgi:hypothetical protein